MNFNAHSAIRDRHAFLSPSTYHWINYTDQKLEARFIAYRAAARGSSLHDLAHQAIKLKVKLANAEKTLAAYVRDGIAYDMAVEQPLFYSDNCFGHADTISFRKRMLRIHDLKTGITPASHAQLEVYAAIFCLEYGISPFDIGIELRIYQNGRVDVRGPEPERIAFIMDKIVQFDNQIEMLKERGEF